MTRTLKANFKPNNPHSADFIKEHILPKLNSKLPAMQDATVDEIVVAASSFFAHGRRSYKLDCSVNPLFEEIRNKLTAYGYFWHDANNPDVFKIGLPNSRLGFITVNVVSDAPRIDTIYNTRYADGSHSEVDRDDITLVNGYPAVTWKIVKPDLQVAYVSGKKDQPTKQYISLDKETLPTTFLKADKEELQSIYEKIIDTAASSEDVWKYQDGLISYDQSLIEKAVRNALIQVVGRADFKFLAEIKQNNRHGVIETVESIGGTA